MWWNRVIFGVGSYELVMWFLTYGMLGWLVESIYMSFCNKKLTNRGFGRGPFCPIYGVGALTVFFLLRPYSENRVLLFFMGSFFATILEYLTALLMQKVFGEVWWDYNEKPFNYKGIICLESTIAWGFYAVGIIQFVHAMVYNLIDRVDFRIGVRLIQVILFIVAVDYTIQLLHVFHVDLKEKKDNMKERCQAFIARWS